MTRVTLWLGRALGVAAAIAGLRGDAGTRFQISGVRVYWAATYEDQEAWRCVKSHGKLVVLAAGQSISGRGADNPRSHWARDLARVVASGRRIN